MDSVYLDYAATTPVDPRVAHKMSTCLMYDGDFGNPASTSHHYGWQAAELVEAARVQVADLINADPTEIIWTSGATESDNLAIKGVVAKHAKCHVITSSYEHKAVLDTCGYVAHKGCDVSYIRPSPDGLVNPESVESEITDSTVLVSIMHVNNEIGTINDVRRIGEICRERDILFHVDAAQSVGKIDVDVKADHIDLLSISGHKIYGPKGIGVLYVNRRTAPKVEAIIHGGGHERGMRSGTLPTHQIVGIGAAAEICKKQLPRERQQLLDLRKRLQAHLMQMPGVTLNGSEDKRIPGLINLAFDGVDGETLLLGLDRVAVSSGSACTSATVEPSYVLRALGVADELASASLRFTVGRFTTQDDVDVAATHVCDVVQKLRS